MYIGEVRVEAAEHFLAGLLTGCNLCGLRVSWNMWRQVAKDRGWEERVSVGPLPEMRERGLSEQEIIDELFAIYKETFRRACSVGVSREAAEE
jgi:hypothetical protein